MARTRTAWLRRSFSIFSIALLFAFGTSGCDRIADMIGKKASQQLDKDIDDSIKKSGKKGKHGSKGDDDDKSAGSGASPSGGATATVDYFSDATSLPKIYKAKIGGPTRVLEMLIYPTYGYAQIQDPKKLENVDQYDSRDGVVQDGAPVKFVGTQPTVANLKEDTFDIDEVDFTAVPKIIADAKTQLKIDDGKATHIILSRPLPFNKDVRFRVYVDGTRKSGSVEYDEKGKMLKVYN